jgi:cytochrome P450
VSALEGASAKLCARALDPFVGSRGFDYARDMGADMPMRVISEMLGIPEGDARKWLVRKGPLSALLLVPRGCGMAP